MCYSIFNQSQSCVTDGNNKRDPSTNLLFCAFVCTEWYNYDPVLCKCPKKFNFIFITSK